MSSTFFKQVLLRDSLRRHISIFKETFGVELWTLGHLLFPTMYTLGMRWETLIGGVWNWGCSESLLRSDQRQLKIESLRSFLPEFLLLLHLQTWSHVSTLTYVCSLGVFEARIFLWDPNISLGPEYFFGRWLEVLAGEAALLLELILLAHLVSLDQAAKLWRVLVVGGHQPLNQE